MPPHVRLWPRNDPRWYTDVRWYTEVMNPLQPERRTEGAVEEALRLHPRYFCRPRDIRVVHDRPRGATSCR